MKELINLLEYLNKNNVLFPVIVVIIILIYFIFNLIKNKTKIIGTIKKITRKIEFQEELEGILSSQNKDINLLKENMNKVNDTLNSYNDNMSELVNIIQVQSKKDNEILDKIDKLSIHLEEQKKIANERTISLFRQNLWKAHKELIERGYTTFISLNEWNNMFTLYQQAGGNGIITKLNEDIQNLPFHSEKDIY